MAMTDRTLGSFELGSEPAQINRLETSPAKTERSDTEKRDSAAKISSSLYLDLTTGATFPLITEMTLCNQVSFSRSEDNSVGDLQ